MNFDNNCVSYLYLGEKILPVAMKLITITTSDLVFKGFQEYPLRVVTTTSTFINLLHHLQKGMVTHEI